jgi:ribose transport system substrate-binding protein
MIDYAGSAQKNRRGENAMGRISMRWAMAVLAVAAALWGGLVQTPAQAQTGTDAEHQQGLQMVPEAARQYYDGYWYFSKVGKNPYENWQPKKAPWQFCYNDSYQGNSWRAAALAEYQKLVAQYADAGLAKKDLIVTNSDNNINVQLSQLNNLVRQGCDVILSIPSSPTGLCSGIKDAHDKGVLVITVESPVECPEAINIDFNEYYGAQQTTKWLVKALGGKGNVMMVNGIPGLAPTVARRQAALDTLKANPGITILGEVNGMWTPSVAKTAVLQFLATHPQKVDGVWDSGLTGVAAAQALQQSGRPPAKINGLPGDCSFIAYWKNNKISSFSLSQGGAPALYEAFVVALRMLNGQKPVVNTILYPLPEITDENLDQWYKPDMTEQSNCFADSPDGRAVPDSFFDPLFTGGQPVSPAPKP